MHDFRRFAPVVGGAFLVLMGIVLVAYQYSRPRGGTIVLPGGITYLGPSPTAPPGPTVNLFTADESVPWIVKRGARYPYAFSAPETLTMTAFLTEQFDAYAITWGDASPEANVLIGVEDLTRDERRAPFVNKDKKEYIESFWAKQYNLTGVATIEEFTSGGGLKGYNVKFLTAGGVSPYVDVFFEIPGKPNLIIHLSHAILEKAVFNRIVHSVTWKQ